MFEDRDLGVIGAGAVLSVMCLLLPIAFPWKVVVGFLTLVLSMVIALLRIGGDGLTLEEWIYRRIRFHFRPRFWTYYSRRSPSRTAAKATSARPEPPRRETDISAAPRKTAIVSWGISARAGEKLAGILLAVIGLYVLGWLQASGAAELGFELGGMLP